MPENRRQPPTTKNISKQKEEEKDKKEKPEILSKGQISTNMPGDGTILGKTEEKSKKDK